MDIKDQIIKNMSESLHELVTCEDFKKNDQNSQIQSIEIYFKNILEDAEMSTKNIPADTPSKDKLNEMYDDYVKEDRKQWISGLFSIILLSFFLFTINNIFNILPRFSFLEVFGCFILLLNIYSISYSYINKESYL